MNEGLGELRVSQTLLCNIAIIITISKRTNEKTLVFSHALSFLGIFIVQ